MGDRAEPRSPQELCLCHLTLASGFYLDLLGDGTVDIQDLLGLLAAWGPCPDPPEECPADLDGDDNVGLADLLVLLANRG